VKTQNEGTEWAPIPNGGKKTEGAKKHRVPWEKTKINNNLLLPCSSNVWGQKKDEGGEETVMTQHSSEPKVFARTEGRELLDKRSSGGRGH